VTPDQQLQAHFRLEKEIERFDNMPEHVMKRLIAENPEKFLRLGFTPGPGHSDIEAPVVVEATEHTPLTSSSEKKKSALSSLFGVFSGKKEDAPVSDITIRQNYSALS
jgi:hypothetical protein